MTENIKDGVESLPMIEKITNAKSVLMVFVVLFTVDLCLLLTTGSNLITYPWQSVKDNIHHGKIALLFGVSLFCYVVVVPVVNGIFWEIAKVIDLHGLSHIAQIFKSSDEDHEFRRIINDRENVPTWALKRWAAENNDSFAYELTKANTASRQRIIRKTLSINHASAALVLLLVIEYKTLNSVLFEMVKLINLHVTGESRLILVGTLVLSIFIPFISWWLSRYPEKDDSKVFYPKAAIERYEISKKIRATRIEIAPH